MKYFSGSVKFFPRKGWPLLMAILTFIILAGLMELLVYQRLLIRKDNLKSDTRNVVNASKENLQEVLVQGISAITTLSFFVQQNGEVKDFDLIASQILATNPEIDVLQLVPGGIIKYVYPLKGNEPVLGYNIFEDSLRKTEAIKAISQKKVFFAGPFILRQGGVGVIGRLPIYRNNRFWGFSAVVIKMATLLKAAGIDTTGRSGYYFQLSKINPDTKEEEFFIPQPKKLKFKNFASVNLPNGEWQLSATPVDEHKGYGDILLEAILGLLFSMMVSVFVFLRAKRPEKLRTLVQLRTAELQASEERYRSLIEQASDGIIVYSFDGTIYQFNKSAYIETGYTKEEFRKLNLKDLLVEKKLTMHQSKASALQSGKTAIIQRKLIKKDGTLMDIEINVSMMSDTTLLAFVRNVTDRKNAERALMESERKFSRVFQSDLLGLAICDHQNTIIDLNQCFASMLETHEELAIENQNRNRFPGKKESKAIPSSIAKILEEGGSLKNHEIQIEKPNGKSIFLLVSVEPLELNNQQNWLITAIDITNKKRAELSLVKSEVKYRSLFEQASDGIVITDLSGIILEVNYSICNMTGYGEPEMLGRPISDFLPHEDQLINPLRIADLLEGKNLIYERKVVNRDGTIMEVEVNSKMASDKTLIGLIRDITERKKAAQDLMISNERFELVALATNDAIWDHDFMLDETTGNDNYYSLYGFKKEVDKIAYDTFINHVDPDDRERVMRNLNNAIREKAVSISEEFRFRNIAGGYKNIYGRAYIKYNDEGKPARIIGVMQDVTWRVEGAEAILKEKELSDSIINSLPAIFYLYNTEGKFLRWNKNFELVSGYTHEDMGHLHPLDLFENEEKKLLEKKISNVLAVGQDTVEADFITKDGRKIPYYFTGLKIEYEGETCLMGFGIDFSGRVQAEARTKESEDKFRSLVEQASDGVAIIQPEGKALYVSPAVSRITGYTDEELLHANIFDLVHPEDSPEVKALFHDALAKPGVPFKGNTYRKLHKDGSWRWLESTITNMMHVSSINGIVENFRDVTDKLTIEKKIITEKELSDSIINSLPGIFYVFDNTGKFIRWNQNFEAVTGYSPAEIRKMNPLDFYDEEQRPLIKERIEQLFQSKLAAAEFLLLTKDRKKIPFYYNSLAIKYEDTPCILAMGFDVTERKQIEQELLVSHKNQEIKASELISSYKELERFTYIVSHDLQEPLRMVSSFLKLLEKKYKGQLDETGDKYIHFAVDGADRMKQLITDLLEYSRTGTNKDIASNTNMNEVVADVLRILKPTIEEERAVIDVGELPVLPNTSKLQMFQLMQNLIGNALKYHSEKKPDIKINVIEEADSWVFSIRDNGIGIDPIFSEKIFVIFQRLHSKNEFSGTGIGLSICKKIVEKHGGKIWVESALGEGSTFYFSISKNLS